MTWVVLAAAALAASVSGRVVGPDGEPVPEATVQVYDLQLRPESTTTDVDGHFLVEGLPAGEWRVSVLSPEDGSLSMAVVGGAVDLCGAPTHGLGPDTALDLGDIELTEGAELAGRLLDAVGAPVVGATVAALPLLPDAAAARVGVTGDDGRFSIGGIRSASTQFALEVEVEGWPRQFVHGDYHTGALYTPEVGAPIDVGDFALLPGVTLRGTVTGPAGPVAEGTVFAQVDGYGGAYEIAADGTFEASGLRAGDALVWAEVVGLGTTFFGGLGQPGALVPAAQEGAVVDAVDLALPLESRVTGRLLGADDFVGASVVLYSDDGPHATVAAVDADGRFELGGLHAGTYVLYAGVGSVALVSTTLQDGDADLRVVVPAEGTTDLGDVELEVAVTVEGFVRDTYTGVAIPGARVYAEGPRGLDLETGIAASDGRFELTGVAPGIWTLYADYASRCPNDPSWVTQFHPQTPNPALGLPVRLDPGEALDWQASLPPDDDRDRMDDVWEREHQLDPTADDALFDPDGDGYSNLEEYWLGTDPQLAVAQGGCGCRVAEGSWPAAAVVVLLALVARGPRRAAWARLGLLTCLAAAPAAHAGEPVRGMTVSCPTWGWEWGSDDMVATLDVLQAHGVNWVSIHPYAGIRGDGTVRWRPVDPERPPDWLARPIAEAHARGMKVMIKPHLAYWGSRFSWRGEIAFEDAAARERFFTQYTAWIADLAAASRSADAFVVGTELDGTVQHEREWRAVIAAARAVYEGPLTYAANWDRFAQVPFWDAVDTIGVQAYFPVVDPGGTPRGEVPSPEELQAGWDRIFAEVRAVHERTGKHVVFTELGYDDAAAAHHEPWASGGGSHGAEIQQACLRAALRAIEREPSVVGAFLWKWFPGEKAHGDFRMSTEANRAVMSEVWRPGPP